MTFRFIIILRTFLLAWLAGLFTIATSWAAADYVEGEVLVTFKATTDLPAAHQVLHAHTLALAKHFKELSFHRHRQTGLVRGTGRTTAALIADLKQDAAVETVEPNYLRWATAAVPTNTTLFAQMWGLQNTGQLVNGTAGTAGDDIRFASAWNAASLAAGEVVVAVIDTGVDYTHPDLVSNLWTNASEIPGNSLDDEGNGYVDDYYGYDFAGNLPSPMDSGLHGTHVSGTIAATGIPVGVVGVNNRAKIMALKASSDGNTFTDAAIIEAIQYATMMKGRGVNIVAINASFGGGSSSSTESAAIQAAGNAGIIFCAAAGNSSANNDTTPTYPASYRLANMIVVAASDQNDALASFSDYGATTVDLAAPGVNILSTVPLSRAGTTASVQQVGGAYLANALTYSGVTTGITAMVVDCGLGYPTNFPLGVNGNIALINRGTLTFAAKVTNAMAAGARAAIIYNNLTGNFLGTLGSSNNWIPTVSISQADGQALRALLPVTATVVNTVDPTQIYQYLDGTSMATPHVAGAVAFAAMNYPSETVAQRIQRILAGVDAVAGLQAKVRTGGRLNLSRIIGVVDTTPPSVSITNPVAGTTYTNAQTVTLRASATDNTGVTRVEFYDTGTLKTNDTSAPYTATWKFALADNGIHAWTARAYDAAGNVTTSAVVSLTVNIPIPCTYAVLPVTVTFGTGSGASNETVTATGSCSWTAASGASWITITAGNSGTGTGTVSYSVSANTGPARSGTLTIAGQSIRVNQPSNCLYGLNPTSTNLTASGSAGSVAVTTGGGCTWTAISNVGWITVTGGNSGTGSGTVSYTIAANEGPARAGTLTVAGQTVTVNQASGCTYTLSATNITTSASVGGSNVTVTAGVGCAWTAASNAAWLGIISGSSGTGNGMVNFSIGANAGPVRTGTLTVAGQAVTITQGSGCTYALSPTNATAISNGGSNTVSVITGAGCAWTAASYDSWLGILSGGSGTGSGAVTYAVVVNPGPARSGTLTIAGQIFTVNQDNGCVYTLSPTNALMGANVGSTNVLILAGAGCGWAATNNESWLTIITDNSGVGTGSVRYTVTANTGPARTGTLTIADGTVTIHQADGCTYGLSLSNTPVLASGGSGNLGVAAGAGCDWTAISNDGWLTITAGASGTGSGVVSYAVAVNISPARTGTLTIAGQTFAVNQDNGCTYGLSATNAAVNASGGAGLVAVTAGAGCGWTAASNVGWLTITSGATGIGVDIVGYLIATNHGPVRSGTLTIAGQSYAVNQANGCTYALSTTSTNVLESGGTGSMAVTTAAGCEWSATSTAPDWLHTSSGGGGPGPVNFTVDANVSTNTRSADLLVQGQAFTVYQTPVICSYTLAEASTNLPARGGRGTVLVNVATPCLWSAASTVDWLATSSTGLGAGHLQFTGAPNTTTSNRTGRITVQDQTLVVSQPPEHPPVITAGLVITNALLNVRDLAVVMAGSNAAFRVTAVDVDGDPLAYQWSFGDGAGSVDSQPWHAYATNICGIYTAAVVVSDGIMPSPTGTLQVAVACQLTITQLQLQPNFAKPKADSGRLTAIFVPGQNFSVPGQSVTIAIGDAQVNFVLNKAGRGVGSNGTCNVTYIKRLGWRITVALKGGAWHSAWSTYGLVDAPIKTGAPVQVPVVVLIGNDAAAADQSLTYTATAGKSGLAK